jgi:two-component system, NarL family, sensor kinase
VASLHWYLRGFEERSGIKATLDAPPELAPLPRDRETAVFRIVQEGLNNIQRHAQSGVARIRLREEEHRLRLEIEDEGRGMPAHLRDDRNAMPSAGVGIAAMQQRVKDLGGEMEIQSGDGGTTIVVSLPITEATPMRSRAQIAAR